MKRLLKRSIVAVTAISIAANGLSGLPAVFAATEVTLSSKLAEYTKPITASGGQSSWQWYASDDAAGTSPAAIEGADTASYIPMDDVVGKWIYCEADGTKSEAVRVVASSSIKMEKIYKDTQVASTDENNYSYCNLGNTEQARGNVKTDDWALGGSVEVVYSGIGELGENNSNIPLLRLNSWGVGKNPQTVAADQVESQENGTWKAVYSYEDMLAAWSGDRDFAGVLALQSYRSGTDASWSVESAKYTGPTFDTTQVPVPTVTLSDTKAVYNKEITATFDGAAASYQWYISKDAAGTGAEEIEKANTNTFTPKLQHTGGWLFCRANGFKSETVRVLASEENAQPISYVPGLKAPANFEANNDYLLINNTTNASGGIDAGKWAPGGAIIAEFSGLAAGMGVERLPKIHLHTWSVDGYTAQYVTGTEATQMENGNYQIRYSYEDLLDAWYDTDKEFKNVKSIQIQYAGDDKTNVKIEKMEYIGPALSFGDTLEAVTTRGGTSASKNGRYLFTAHVGGAEFDPTRMREDSYLYLEYAESEDVKKYGTGENAYQMVLQSMSDGNSNGSTYTTIPASEWGKTGSGYYSIFNAKDIQEAFAAPNGSKLRMLDRITINLANDKTVNSVGSVPALYFYEGKGALLDDISADGYKRAVDVHWTKYDDTDKNGIVVIGASISQNPLVTPKALEGHPYYAAGGGWNAVLDRTDVVTFGIGSQTTTDIKTRFHEILSDKYDYDTIIMQCGNNDLGNINGDNAPERAAKLEFDNYSEMMKQVKEKNKDRALEGKKPIHVYIIAINNVDSRDVTNPKIQAVVEKLNTLEGEYDFVTYIEDINKAFRPGYESDVYAPSAIDLVMDDGLHPVAAGYAIHARFLKPLLASTDKSDASLVSLSLRADGNSRKYPVEGFKSRAEGVQEYSDRLAAGVTDTVRLYITPNNLDATVKVMDGTEELEVKCDLEGSPDGKTEDGYGNPYGNDYVEVDMTSGSKTIEVTVTSVDESNTSTFTVNLQGRDKNVVFAADDVQFDLNDDVASVTGSTPYKQITAPVTGKGLVLSYDVEGENLASEQDLQLRVLTDWNDKDTKQVKASDFRENYTYHVERTLTGEFSTKLENVIVTFNPTDYRGVLTIKNIEIKTSAQVSE